MKPPDHIDPHNLHEASGYLLHPRVITMLFFGFSAGIPLLLIFSSLSLWLGEAGVEAKTVTFFSWAALGYSFKFIWAPLIDKIPLPYLTRALGRRRAWMLLAQIAIAAAIVLMGSVNPAAGYDNLTMMAAWAVFLGFSAATQDIVIDAYRIESAEPRLQAMMSSAYIAGYRVGMIISGAGALYLASWLGSSKAHYLYSAWQWTYYLMALTMLVGMMTTLIIDEPESKRNNPHNYHTLDYLRLLFVFLCSVTVFIVAFFKAGHVIDDWKDASNSGNLNILLNFLLEAGKFSLAVVLAAFSGLLLVKAGSVNQDMARETWIDPVIDFFNRYGAKTALTLLALIGLYRIADIIPGIISNVFYQDLGFTKPEIATAVKTFGVIVSIIGGFMGGIYATSIGVMRTLMMGAILTAFTNLVFVWLAYEGHNIEVMYLAVTVDNLAAGFASAAFVAFLSSLTSVSFTAMQYAIFSSLMTLIPKAMGGYSGTIVSNIGYPGFFLFVTFIGIPVLWLVWRVEHLLHARQ